MASQRQVEVVAELHDAFTTRDVDRFLSHLTDDVVLRPTAFITGREEYRGIDDIRTGFAEINALVEKMSEEVTVEPKRFYVDRANDDVVLSLAVVSIIREDGESLSTDVAYLMEMDGDKVARFDAWLSHDEGLRQLKEPAEASVG